MEFCSLIKPIDNKEQVIQNIIKNNKEIGAYGILKLVKHR